MVATMMAPRWPSVRPATSPTGCAARHCSTVPAPPRPPDPGIRSGSAVMMTCGVCGASQGAGDRFCGDCGARLGGCPSCGEPVTAGKPFCRACGFALSEAQPSRSGITPPAVPDRIRAAVPVAERRVCSVLFCDLVGFTPLSESRDAEAVRELLSEYFAVARTVIGRYGGPVGKLIGDAVMAVWGTPVATEGDAERAVRAALDLVAAVSQLRTGIPGLAARAGVVTGEVAVTLGAVGEGMVAGDAVNTAARVQSAADTADTKVARARKTSAGRAGAWSQVCARGC